MFHGIANAASISHLRKRQRAVENAPSSLQSTCFQSSGLFRLSGACQPTESPRKRPRAAASRSPKKFHTSVYLRNPPFRPRYCSTIMIKLTILLTLAIIGISSCSKSPGKIDKEVFPKPGRLYFYVGDKLIASLDKTPNSDDSASSPYYMQLFGGRILNPSGNSTQYTLENGSIIFKDRKTNSEVARFTSEKIVWYGDSTSE